MSAQRADGGIVNGGQQRQYRADFIVRLDDNHMPCRGCNRDRLHGVGDLLGN